MKKLIALFLVQILMVNFSSCTISKEYYLSEKQEEINKPVTSQTATQGSYNETFDNIKDLCNGFNIINGLLYIDMSKKLYMYDPNNGDRISLCPDPSCSHNSCLWGSDSEACQLTPHNEIVTYEDKVFFIRVLAKRSAQLLDNGMPAIYDYQIISADFNGENIKIHHETIDYIPKIYPMNEDYMYFCQRDSYDGTYGLYKLTYKNNDIDLLNSYVSFSDVICEKNSYLYYSDSYNVHKMNLNTLEDEVVFSGCGSIHYDDTYIYFLTESENNKEDSSIFRYTFETGAIDEIVSGISRFRVSDQHIFFTKNEGLIVEGPNRNYKDALSGRIYMCNKDGSNILLIRDDYEKIYYRSFYMYQDKLYAEFYYYDENLVDNLVNHNEYFYGYVTIGDMNSDFTTFNVQNIME